MIYVLTNVSKTQDVPLDGTIRDFKIRYGKGLLRLHKVKITSGDVTTRVAVQLSRRSSFSAVSNCLLCRTLRGTQRQFSEKYLFGRRFET